MMLVNGQTLWRFDDVDIIAAPEHQFYDKFLTERLDMRVSRFVYFDKQLVEQQLRADLDLP